MASSKVAPWSSASDGKALAWCLASVADGSNILLGSTSCSFDSCSSFSTAGAVAASEAYAALENTQNDQETTMDCARTQDDGDSAVNTLRFLDCGSGNVKRDGISVCACGCADGLSRKCHV